MGLYNFTMLRFLPDIKQFDLDPQREKTITGIFTKEDANNIIDVLKSNSSNFVRRDTALKIQNALNKMVNEQYENYILLLSKIVTELNNKNYNNLININNNLVSLNEGTVKLNRSAISGYEKQLHTLANELSKKHNIKEDNLASIFNILNGSLNTLRGDIFEYFLGVIFNESAKSIQNIVDVGEDELIDTFIKGINNLANKNKLDIKAFADKRSNFKSRVMGADLKENINITIDNAGMTIQGAQGKTDVAISNLSGDNIFKGISAKNYSNTSRHISLLSGANILGLITQWPTDINRMNLALNGLSAKSISLSQQKIMKDIFLIQGLMGLENEDIKSELFIINTNAKENPFLVFSVYDLLFTDNIQGKFDWSKMSPIRYSKGGRTLDQFMNFINSARLSIKVNMTINQMAQLNKT